MQNQSDAAAKSFPDLSRLKVVIVDDLAFGREVARSLLVAAGVHNIAAAVSVEEGWKLVRNFHPDLLIADWQMEDAPGITLLRLVRESPDSPNRFMPVLMLTAYREQNRVLEAMGAGTTSYLVKPFTPRDFYTKLRFCVEDRRDFVQKTGCFGPAQKTQSVFVES